MRRAAPAAILAACAALAATRLSRPAPADPCLATPEIHACAMFLQPEWMIRRAQAGRSVAAGPRPAAPVEVETTGALAAPDEAGPASGS